MLAPTDGSFAHEARRNESPSHLRQFPDWLLRILANHRDWLGRCDVVPGSPILFVRGAIEVFLDDLLSAREAIASAHARIMADPWLLRMVDSTEGCYWILSVAIGPFSWELALVLGVNHLQAHSVSLQRVPFDVIARLLDRHRGRHSANISILPLVNGHWNVAEN